MTNSEMLELILSRLDKIETDVSSLKTDVSSLKTDVSSLKTDVSSLKENVSSLQDAQLKTQTALENVIDKSIQVLYEGYTLNAERLDRYDIEAIKRNTEIAVTLAKMTYEASKKAV